MRSGEVSPWRPYGERAPFGREKDEADLYDTDEEKTLVLQVDEVKLVVRDDWQNFLVRGSLGHCIAAVRAEDHSAPDAP